MLDWNGKNEAGEQVNSGIYFYNIMAGEFTDSKKMIIERQIGSVKGLWCAIARTGGMLVRFQYGNETIN